VPHRPDSTGGAYSVRCRLRKWTRAARQPPRARDDDLSSPSPTRSDSARTSAAAGNICGISGGSKCDR
jgi:hypothetical protein